MANDEIKLDLYDIVRRLTGEICPAGDSCIDERRLKSLKATIRLVEQLIGDIAGIAELKDRPEHSIRQAGNRAEEFLCDLRQDLRNE